MELRRAGLALVAAGESVGAHGRQVTADWVGNTSDAAHAKITMLGRRTEIGGEVCGDVVPILMRYAAELRAAQRHYADGEAQAAAGQAALTSLAAAPVLAVPDPGHDAALRGARTAVSSGNDTMTAAVAWAERANAEAAWQVQACTEALADMTPEPPAPPAAAAAAEDREAATWVIPPEFRFASMPVPSPSPGPPPVPPAESDDDDDEGGWVDGVWHHAKGFGGSMWDSVKEPFASTAGLVGLNGDTSDNWSDLFGGYKESAQHPVETGKGIIAWDDWAAGEWGAAAGSLISPFRKIDAFLPSKTDLTTSDKPAGAPAPGRGTAADNPRLHGEYVGRDRPLYDQLQQPTVSRDNAAIVDRDYDPLGGHDGPEEFAERYWREPRDPLEDADWDWPPNNGAVPGTRTFVELPPGTRLDRIGGNGGEYFAPEGTPFAERSLPPDRLNFGRRSWTIDVDHPSLRDGTIRVEQSEVAPAFGQPGGGLQQRFVNRDGNPVSTGELIRLGILPTSP